MFWAKVGVATALVMFLLYRGDLSDVWNTAKSADLLLLLAIMILFFPGVYLSVLKWQLLLAALGVTAPQTKLYPIYLASTFLNNFAPSTVGGDIGRVYYAAKSTSKPSKVTASVVVERATGVVALALWVLLASTIEYDLARKSGIILVLLVGVLATFLALAMGYLLWRSRLWESVRMGRLEGLVVWVTVLLAGISDSFRVYRSAPGALVVSLVLSMGFHLVTIYGAVLLFRALDLDVSLTQLMLLIPAISLLGLFPFSVNGWGIREGGYTFLFTQVGLTFDQALAAALLGRSLLMLVSLSGGIVLLFSTVGWLSLEWQSRVSDQPAVT